MWERQLLCWVGGHRLQSRARATWGVTWLPSPSPTSSGSGMLQVWLPLLKKWAVTDQYATWFIWTQMPLVQFSWALWPCWTQVQYLCTYVYSWGCPRWLSGKEPHCQCRRHKRRGFDPWVGKIPWRKWQPTAVLLPGESYGQRSLAGHSSWGHNELDLTEHTRSPVIVYTRSLVMCIHMYVSISPYKCKHTHLYSIYICNVCIYI